MTETQTLQQAAETLDVTVHTLLKVISIGDIIPSIISREKDVWNQDEEIEFTEEDMLVFRAELDRRQFKDLRQRFPDLIDGRAELYFGPGWTQMVEDMLLVIRERFKPGQFRLFHGKEKFGNIQLSFGCDDTIRDDIYAIMDELRKVSLSICDECGKPGRLRLGYSIAKTTCDHHAHIVGELRPEDGLYLDVQDWVDARRREKECGNDNK